MSAGGATGIGTSGTGCGVGVGVTSSCGIGSGSGFTSGTFGDTGGFGSSGTGTAGFLPMATVDDDNVLTVRFEKNPEHRAASAYDSVYLWVYSAEAGKGYLTNAVYRRAKRIDVLLPEWLGDSGLHLYAFVQDKDGRCSSTAYGRLSQGVGDEEDGTGDEDEVVFASGAARLTILDCDIPASADKGGNSKTKDSSILFRYLSVITLLHALWGFV